MESLNTSLFLLVNAGPQPPPTLLRCAVFLAEWLLYGVPMLLTLMWLRGTPRRRKESFFALLAICLALLCGQLLNALWPQPRPFMLGLGHTYLAHRPESAFPSDHATLCFALAASLWLGGQRLAGLGAFLVGVLIGWARVYLGVHFPLDVLGALPVGVFGALVVSSGWFRRSVGDPLFGLAQRVYQRLFDWPRRRGWVR